MHAKFFLPRLLLGICWCAAAHAAEVPLPASLPKLFLYSSSGLPVSVKMAEEMQKEHDNVGELVDCQQEIWLRATQACERCRACLAELQGIAHLLGEQQGPEARAASELQSKFQDLLTEEECRTEQAAAMRVRAVVAGHGLLHTHRFKRQAHAITYIPLDQVTSLIKNSLSWSDRAMSLLVQLRNTDWRDYLWLEPFFAGIFVPVNGDVRTIVEQAIPITYTRCSKLRNGDVPEFFKGAGSYEIPTCALAENTTHALLILAMKRGYSVHALKYTRELVKSTKSKSYEKTDLFRQLELSSFPHEADSVKKSKLAVRKAILPGVSVSKPTLAELCDVTTEMAGK